MVRKWRWVGIFADGDGARGFVQKRALPQSDKEKDDTICYWILFCSFFSIVADKSKLWETMRIGAGLVCPKSILNHFVHVLTCWICTSFFSSFLRTSWKLPKTSASAHVFSSRWDVELFHWSHRRWDLRNFPQLCGLRFEHGNPHPRCCGPESFQGPDWHNVSYSGAACPICSGRHRNVADECFAGAADSFFSAETTSCLYRLFML